MTQRTVERVEDWPTRRFNGGYAGLHDLAAEEFSGAVAAPGGGWLLMTGGRVVSVPEGGIGRFEDGGGPARVAPEPAVPLLFAMQTSEGETRGEYYTEDTPLSDVDATLREGGFTGYVELSENVLSGDYYLVYHAGERNAVAYIGTADRLKTSEEAFERAADEVGIYTVVAVDVTVAEIPGAPTTTGATSATENGADGQAAASGSTATTGPEESPAGGTIDETGTAGDPSEVTGPSTSDSVADGAMTTDADPAADGDATATDASIDSDGSRGTPAEGTDPSAGAAETGGRAREGTDAPADTGEGPTSASLGDEQLTPAVRPAEDAGTSDEGDTDHTGAGAEADRPAEGVPAATVNRLRNRVSELQRERETLRGRLESTTAERDRLRARIDELEAELESHNDTGRSVESMEPAEALAGTNLFVRYDSKSEATLEDAHEGGLNHETVSRNLGLEHHTRFDADAVSVGGEPFESFLKASTEYRFVRWLLTELLYEIRDTDNVQGMRELYDALPEIDRAELGAAVETGDAEREFDVVFRNRVGDPLAVADLSASRAATTATDLETLLDGAGSVADDAGSLVGAFLVTASYFEPEALETAEAAADSGGLLSRSKRESYVKRDNGGFHLCLVEGRDQRFHIVLPAL